MPGSITEMIGNRRLASLLGCLVAALGALSVAAAPSGAGGAQPLVIAPAAPLQGDTVAIIVHADAGARVSVRFNGTSVPVFPVSEGAWRALRGTDPDTPPGTYPVAAVITPPGGNPVSVRGSVRISPRKFLERHLTLPPSTVALITPKNLAIEREALNSVLGRRAPEAMWLGPFREPVSGPIDSPYGEMGFYNGVREWWHQGVDYPNPAGTPVTAANSGIVVLARALPLGGNTVVIDHGQGVLTEYLHLASFAVQAGQHVARGDMIGRIGATGLVTGPSLHWGLYADGHWVNPLFWTTARPGLTD